MSVGWAMDHRRGTMVGPGRSGRGGTVRGVSDGTEYERDDVGGVAPAEVLIAPTDALKLLRAGSADRDKMIERFGGTGAPERDIESELANDRPLEHPELFADTFRAAMYSIEVLDRHGARGARLPTLGPFKPVAAVLVSLVTRWIVKSHQNTVVTRISRLCSRREAVAVEGSQEHVLLRRARFRMRLVEEGYRGSPIGLPVFLVSGAVLSTVAATLQGLIESVIETSYGELVLFAISVLLIGSVAWVALFSAAVARRRIRMTTDQPVRDLWLVIGHCGRPPRDRSIAFAIYAIVLSIVAWVAVPFFFYLLADRLGR
jgi:hypothetical protein